MKTITLITTAALTLCASFTTKYTVKMSDNATGQDGWITLFDGKSTAGWHTYNKKAAGQVWKAEGGALHLDPVAKKEMKDEGGDLITDEEFGNYDLKLEWKISPKGNSGVVFYIHEDPSIKNTYETGPEMQVLDNGSPIKLGHADGKIYTHRAGDLYDLLASKDAAKPQGEWNAAEIISKNGRLDFYLNGQHTLSTAMWDANWQQMVAISKFKDWKGFGMFKKGRIGLQDHGDEVWFRNIKIKKL